MNAPAPATFDPLGPLPRGRLAIEASAGTGKTHTLANLALRYVIEDGVGIDEVLIVTFTRAAAGELADRVRRRLREMVLALAAALDGDVDPSLDDVAASLCGRDVAVRHQRAVTALAEFDAANITTIHSFAQQALNSLGANAPGDPDAVLADDLTQLLRQVGSDVLVRAALALPPEGDGDNDGGDQDAPAPAEAGAGVGAEGGLPTLDTLTERVREIVGNPGIRVIPSGDPSDSNPDAARIRRLVDEMVAEMDRRRRLAGTMSYDGLLTRLLAAIEDPETGRTAREIIRRRVRVALVDEFQDTDPVQWNIFRILFGESSANTALVLVGDPKQAIYGFRGANVATYLDAIGAPGTDRAVLDTNWRSDGALLVGLEALLTGATFGDPRIAFRSVRAVDGRDRTGDASDEGAPPTVSVRLALDPSLRGKAKLIKTATAARAIADDLARTLRDLLETGRIPDRDGRDGATRAVVPGDVAVLVGTHSESPVMRDALASLAIPAVINRGETVMTSPAAQQWRRLLGALAQPADPSWARTAALSWFVGWSADELVASDDRALAPVQERLGRWSHALVSDGVAELRRMVWTESGVSARVLAMTDGDRSMTDLEHIAELLARDAPRHIGPVGLLALFDQLTLDTDIAELDVEVAARRVESDDDAVQIMTVHAAKGLEFGVVCIPTLWRASQVRTTATIFRDPGDDARTIDVANQCKWPTGSAAAARKDLAKVESVGQSLRLLYVALSRARHSVFIWWSHTTSADRTGLARILFARDANGIDPAVFVAPKVALPVHEDAADVLSAVVEGSDGAVEVAIIGAEPAPTRPWAPDTSAGPGELVEARLERALDRRRRRWSFTALTAGAYHASPDPFDASLGDAGADDERSGDEHAGGGGSDGRGAVAGTSVEGDEDGALVLGSIAGGTAFGTLVHEVLEHVDFAAAALDAELEDAIADATVRRGLDVDQGVLAAGLSACLDTPLGPLLDHRPLKDFRRTDRLDELEFELHLAPGRTAATDADVGALVRAHLDDDHPLRDWAEELAAGRFGHSLAGHLVGSIDAVLRVTDPNGGPDRFVVVDYKTNRLSPPGAEPRAADYHPERLPAAMAGHDYPLQALLYSAALHRYLRWRLTDYDPAIHLGGIAYLFVRGMTGRGVPHADGHPHGVFAWRPAPELITELSDLLDGKPTSRSSS